jgi:hypothetical protein
MISGVSTNLDPGFVSPLNEDHSLSHIMHCRSSTSAICREDAFLEEKSTISFGVFP